nr:hypothetical protein [Streptomyces sp. MMBL 11-1]
MTTSPCRAVEVRLRDRPAGPGRFATTVREYDMESVSAVFAGMALSLFGAALLIWTGARALHRAPVAHGVSPVASTALTTLFGLVFLGLGVWCFTLV